MWSTLTVPWQEAVKEAWAAALAGSRPTGAVIVDSKGGLISKGRERSVQSGEQGRLQLSGNRLAHAELNALLDLHRTPVPPFSCTLYTTCEPCLMCFGAAQQSAVGSVRFACSSGEGVAAKIIEEKNQTVLIVPPPYGDFEDLLAAMQVEYGLRTYGGAWTDKQTWRTQNRFAFLAGEALYRSDLLEQLREQRLEAKVMVERLAAGIERVRSLYQV